MLLELVARPDLFSHVWEALPARSRRQLFAVSRALRRATLPLIRTIAFSLPPDNAFGGEAVGRLAMFPQDLVSLLQWRQLTVKIDRQSHPTHVNLFTPTQQPNRVPGRVTACFMRKVAVARGKNVLKHGRHLTLHELIIDMEVRKALEEVRPVCLVHLTLTRCFYELTTFHSEALRSLKSLTLIDCDNFFSRTGSMSITSLTGLTSLEVSCRYGPFGDNGLTRDDVEVCAHSWRQLQSLSIPHCVISNGGVEALLQRFLGLTRLSAMGLWPTCDLSEVPCPWQELELYDFTPEHVAKLPLMQLQRPLFAPPLRPIMRLDLGDTAAGVVKAVNKLLTCSVLTTRLFLRLGIPEGCRLDALKPLVGLQPHLQGIGTSMCEEEDEVLAQLDPVVGGTLEVLEVGGPSYLLDFPESFPQLKELQMVVGNVEGVEAIPWERLNYCRHLHRLVFKCVEKMHLEHLRGGPVGRVQELMGDTVWVLLQPV